MSSINERESFLESSIRHLFERFCFYYTNSQYPLTTHNSQHLNYYHRFSNLSIID